MLVSPCIAWKRTLKPQLIESSIRTQNFLVAAASIITYRTLSSRIATYLRSTNWQFGIDIDIGIFGFIVDTRHEALCPVSRARRWEYSRRCSPSLRIRWPHPDLPRSRRAPPRRQQHHQQHLLRHSPLNFSHSIRNLSKTAGSST